MKKRKLKQLTTIWSEKDFNPSLPLSEYPRPQMVRDSYLCLNGAWELVITNSKANPDAPVFQGRITVPYSPEAYLSGVNRITSKDEVLIYTKSFSLPEGFDKGRILLNIGAIDQTARIFFNDVFLADYTQGYLPLTVELPKQHLKQVNTLKLYITDNVDDGRYPRGKQSSRPGGIWYTPQSGIWQTIWLESVPETYIRSISHKSEINLGRVDFDIQLAGSLSESTEITLSSKAGGFCVGCKQGRLSVQLEHIELWSPENPFLYDLEITAGEDVVRSYFALRHFCVDKDERGVMRFFLNNAPYFIHGVLDQGYWPDGLYTPPSDEALEYDIKTCKQLGFNTLRKHIKIEPLRWYYHCDRLGMLVWQDMVSSGAGYNPLLVLAAGFLNIPVRDGHYRLFGMKNVQARIGFLSRMKSTVELLRSTPCVAVWSIFNEGWGQFDANFATETLWAVDNTRPVDQASGWFDQGGGDFKSLHVYYKKIKLPRDGRAIALTEFGGYTLEIPEHTAYEKSFGYKKTESIEQFNLQLGQLYENEVFPLIEKGLCAAIYTQLSDVEEELNGIMTFDRKVIKLISPITPPNNTMT